jgi:hypothetical protein
VRLDIIGEAYVPRAADESFFLNIRGVTNSHPDDSVVLKTVQLSGFVPPREFISIPLQVPVTAGEMLSFVGYGARGTFIGIAFPDFSTQSAYEFGRHWMEGTPPFGLEGSGTWYPNRGGFSPMELSFRTYVEPSKMPEPATLGLSVIGLIRQHLARRLARTMRVANRCSGECGRIYRWQTNQCGAKMKKPILMAAAIVTLVLSGSSHANLVFNGGFELGNVPIVGERTNFIFGWMTQGDVFTETLETDFRHSGSFAA